MLVSVHVVMHAVYSQPGVGLQAGQFSRTEITQSCFCFVYFRSFESIFPQNLFNAVASFVDQSNTFIFPFSTACDDCKVHTVAGDTIFKWPLHNLQELGYGLLLLFLFLFHFF